MKRPEGTFVSECDGSLIRLSDGKVLRPLYSRPFRDIDNSHELRATIRNGPYAWPGGYPLFLLFSDGATLCFKCAESEYFSLAYSMKHRRNDGWRVVACDINYEDDSMYCAHCGTRIEPAYERDDDHEDVE